jgi:hypothetical protein
VKSPSFRLLAFPTTHLRSDLDGFPLQRSVVPSTLSSHDSPLSQQRFAAAFYILEPVSFHDNIIIHLQHSKSSTVVCDRSVKSSPAHLFASRPIENVISAVAQHLAYFDQLTRGMSYSKVCAIGSLPTNQETCPMR